MIIAHFFLRNVRKKKCLFVETTSSHGLEQPSPAAQFLMQVSDSDKRIDWVKGAYYEFTRRFPNLVLIDAMDNSIRLESSHPSFDLVFRPKEPVMRLEDELRKSERPVLSVIRSLFSQKSMEN